MVWYGILGGFAFYLAKRGHEWIGIEPQSLGVSRQDFVSSIKLDT